MTDIKTHTNIAFIKSCLAKLDWTNREICFVQIRSGYNKKDNQQPHGHFIREAVTMIWQI